MIPLMIECPRKMRNALAFSLLGLFGMSLGLPSASAEPLGRLSLHDAIGHDWTNELVSFSVSQFPSGRAYADRLRIVDSAGKGYPVQVAEASTHADGSLSACVVWTRVNLPANGSIELILEAGQATAPDVPARASRDDASLTLENGLIAVRLPVFKPLSGPVALKDLPAPIQAVRIADKPWMGKSWFVGGSTITGVTAEITAVGPLFAEAVVDYFAADARFYSVRVKVPIGEPVAIVKESFDLPAPQDGPEDVQWTDPADGGRVPTFCLGLSEGFDPDVLRVKGYTTSSGTNRWIRTLTRTTEGDLRVGTPDPQRLFCVTAHMSWWSDLGHYAAALRQGDGADGSVLGIMRLMPSHWFNPVGLQFWNDPQRGLYMAGNLGITGRRSWEVDGIHDAEVGTEIYSGTWDPTLPRDMGRRAWGIYVGTKDAMVSTNYAIMDSPVNHLMIRLGEFPLDKVRHWVLEWKDSGERYPRLLNRPEEAAAVAARIRNRKPGDFGVEPNLNDPSVAFLLRGNSADGHSLVTNVIARSSVIKDLFRGGATGVSTHFHPMTAVLRKTVMDADDALSVPEITPDEAAQVRKLVAFLTYVLDDRDFNPTGTGCHLATPNMALACDCMIGMAGCLLPSHPDAARWASRGASKLTLMFDRLADPVSGAWEECPHYMMETTFRFAFELFNALRNSGYGDLFELPSVKSTLRYSMGIMSPPDPRFGIRILGPQGNSSLEGCTVLGWAAAAYRNTDPPLSSELQWMWDADGRQTVYEGSLAMIRPDLPMKAPVLVSTWYRGFGAVLRNGFPSSNETWMAYRLGQRMSHYENGDQGSWHLYAKGAPLSLDFGSQYGPIMERPWLHNRISVDHKMDPMLLRHHDIDEFTATPAADFVSGCNIISNLIPCSETPYEPMKTLANMPAPAEEMIPPVTWRRSILFVKDGNVLGPNYFVVRDSFDGATRPTDWSCWCLARDAKFEGNMARFTGQYGVDMDVVVLSPAKAEFVRNRDPIPPPPKVCKLSYGPGVSGWPKEYSEPAEAHPPIMSHNFSYLGEFWKRAQGTNVFEERQICARVKASVGEGYFVLLYPRRHEGEEIPAYAAWAGANGAKLTFKNGRHFVISARTTVDVSVDGVDARAATAVVRDMGERKELDLIRGEFLKFGDLKIEGGGPASVRVKGNAVEGESDGVSRKVIVTVPRKLVVGKTLWVDGKPAGKIEGPRFEVGVGFGPHVFRVE